jgi:hypothetical protein
MRSSFGRVRLDRCWCFLSGDGRASSPAGEMTRKKEPDPVPVCSVCGGLPQKRDRGALTLYRGGRLCALCLNLTTEEDAEDLRRIAAGRGGPSCALAYFQDRGVIND